MNFGVCAYERPRVQEGGESSSTNISGDEIASSSNGIGSKRRSELVIPHTTLRPESGDSATKQSRIDGWKPNFWPTTLANSIAPKVLKNGASTTASSSSISSSSPEEDSVKREWEEELLKVEKKSRKSSDLLGFFKRKRSEGIL